MQGPFGDSARHLPLDALERGLAALAPPKDRGSVSLVVARREDGVRETPGRAVLTRQEGVPGDAWFRVSPERFDTQISVMRADVAELFRVLSKRPIGERQQQARLRQE